MYYRNEEHHPEHRIFAMVLYVVASLSAVFQFFPPTIILGLILLVLANFMNKVFKATAKETIYITHAEWIGRTLYVGTFFLFPLSLAAAAYLIWTTTDVSSFKATIAKSDADDPSVAMSIINSYMVRDMPAVAHICTVTLAPPVFWWVRRCLVGYRRAQESEPIDYPEGLL